MSLIVEKRCKSSLRCSLQTTHKVFQPKIRPMQDNLHLECLKVQTPVSGAGDLCDCFPRLKLVDIEQFHDALHACGPCQLVLKLKHNFHFIMYKFYLRRVVLSHLETGCFRFHHLLKEKGT